MKTFNLHYAKMNLTKDEDIVKYEFKTNSKLLEAVEFIIIVDEYDCVWLLAKDGCQDIFISENKESIIDFISKMSGWNKEGDYFLQAYRTYNEAYEVALMIVESYSNLTD